MQDNFKVEFADELKAAETALEALKEKLAQAPGHDWRSSIAWEAVEAAQQVMADLMADAFYIESFDRLRPDWRHWRDRYDVGPAPWDQQL
jgi:hypothetical protein